MCSPAVNASHTYEITLFVAVYIMLSHIVSMTYRRFCSSVSLIKSTKCVQNNHFSSAFLLDFLKQYDPQYINIYIFIHQNGSTQKENTNIQTKSSIKNTPHTMYIHRALQYSQNVLTEFSYLLTKFLTSFFDI